MEGQNAVLNSENDLTAEGLAKGTLGRLYPPTIIATEQTRESASFGTLTTPDEVKEVVLPSNGLIVIGYTAFFGSSVSGAGRAALFIGANQLKRAASPEPVVQEVSTETTVQRTVNTASIGLVRGEGQGAYVTTGQTLSPGGETQGGVCHVFAAAGTYSISVQFKATSGKITVSQRKLWVGVLGV